LHYDPMEFSRRLLLPHLNKQINNTHTYIYIYTCIYVFVRDRRAFQCTRGVSPDTSLTIYVHIVSTCTCTTFITVGIVIKLSLLAFNNFGAYFFSKPLNKC
jgi:ABC-type Mn2+/Zn2+ transport system permease subunit